MKKPPTKMLCLQPDFSAMNSSASLRAHSHRIILRAIRAH